MAELLSAMRAVDDVPVCAVMHDGCDIYDIDYPDNWHLYRSSEHLEMQRALNLLYAMRPGEPFYGMIDDHTRPTIKGWSQALASAAGSWRIASAWNETNRHRLLRGAQRMRINCFAIGGSLARTLGWVWPPQVIHLFGDDIWEDVGYELGIIRHEKAARMRSLLLRDGTLKPDENSKRLWRGTPYVTHDMSAYTAWRRNEWPELKERLKRVIPAECRNTDSISVS